MQKLVCNVAIGYKIIHNSGIPWDIITRKTDNDLMHPLSSKQNLTNVPKR